MSRHVYIKWSYITINDEEIDPSKEFIKLKNKNQIDAYNLFNLKYTELCNVLFSEKENDNLQLNLSKMYYLGTDSNSSKDLVLRKFFDDSSDNQEGDIKPIYLSRESYDLEVYKLFSIILSGFADWDEDFGYLSLGFDDTRGYICFDGDQQQEISISVSEVGIRWMWWREVEDKTIELKEELEEAVVSLIHLTSFAVLFDSFFGYNKAKSMDELHQLIKYKIYNGSWDLFKENWSESCGLYDQLLDGIKTYEEAFDKMVVTLKGSNLDENQTTAFLDLTLKMYLDTSKSKGVLDNELNEDNSFNTNHPNYNKFNVFSYLEKSFENQVVVEFLNSKRPLLAQQQSYVEYRQTIFLKENFHKVFTDNFLKTTTIENEFIHIDIEGSSLNISYNLDENDIDDSIFNDDEIPFYEIISELEEKLPQLKDFFTEDFEIIYFTYDSEYTSTIWQFENNKLSTNTGWIGDFCEVCESIEDADERDDAQSEFVNENSAELKEGCPSDELLKAMREGLYKI
jgi:hypothetical protein